MLARTRHLRARDLLHLLRLLDLAYELFLDTSRYDLVWLLLPMSQRVISKPCPMNSSQINLRRMANYVCFSGCVGCSLPILTCNSLSAGVMYRIVEEREVSCLWAGHIHGVHSAHHSLGPRDARDRTQGEFHHMKSSLDNILRIVQVSGPS